MAEETDTHNSVKEQDPQSVSPSSYSEGGSFVKQTQAPFGGFCSPNGDVQFLPIMYPGFLQQNQEQNYGRGLYAVPPFSFMGPAAPYPPNTLIPFTYNLPTASETRGVGEGQGQSDQRQQLQPPAERVVVRRFQFGLRLDMLLILKLVTVMFLFNQDGSMQRLLLIGFFVSLVYLYQTGALAPLIRWLSQGMQRAAAPLQPPRPAARADENAHAPGRAGQENPPVADGQPRGGANEDHQPVDGERAANDPAVENREAAAAEQGQRWWGIVKEIQLFVFGFITSLLPGFHNVD